MIDAKNDSCIFKIAKVSHWRLNRCMHWIWNLLNPPIFWSYHLKYISEGLSFKFAVIKVIFALARAMYTLGSDVTVYNAPVTSKMKILPVLKLELTSYTLFYILMKYKCSVANNDGCILIYTSKIWVFMIVWSEKICLDKFKVRYC